MTTRIIPTWAGLPDKPSIGDLSGVLPLDKLPAHTHSWSDISGVLPLDKLPAHTHSNLVPYSGATADVDLGSYALIANRILLGGSTGPRLDNNAGTIRARTNNGLADAPISASVVTASANLVVSAGTNAGKTDAFTYGGDAYLAQYNGAGSIINYLRTTSAGNLFHTSTFSGNVTINGATTGTRPLSLVPSSTFNGLFGIALAAATNGAERAGFLINPSSGEIRIGATTGGSYFPTLYSNGIEMLRGDLLGNATFIGTVSAPAITLSGNVSRAAWTVNGIGISHVNRTFTDTTSVGTVAAAYSNVLGGNTIAASSAVTYTEYASLFLGSPTAGTNVTITNPFSLVTAGAVKVGGNVDMSSNLSDLIVNNQLATTYNFPQIRAAGYETGISLFGNTVVGIISNNVGVAAFGTSGANGGMLMRVDRAVTWSTAQINGAADSAISRAGTNTLQIGWGTGPDATGSLNLTNLTGTGNLVSGGGGGLGFFWGSSGTGSGLTSGFGHLFLLSRSGNRFTLGTANNVSLTGVNAGASALHFNNGASNLSAVGTDGTDTIVAANSGLVRIVGSNATTPVAIRHGLQSSTAAPNTTSLPSGATWWQDTTGNTRRFAYNDSGVIFVSPLLRSTTPATPTDLPGVISVLQHWGLCA